MRKQYFILPLSVFILFYSCGQKKKQRPVKNEYQKISNEKTLNHSEEKSFQYVENDSSVKAWRDALLLLSKDHSYFDIKTELSQNPHNPKQTDTINVLTLGSSEIVTYATNEFYSIWTATIRNETLPLSDYIKVGIKKEGFEKILKTKLTSNTIKVGNLEQTIIFEFEFIDEALKKIEFEVYVD